MRSDPPPDPIRRLSAEGMMGWSRQILNEIVACSRKFVQDDTYEAKPVEFRLNLEKLDFTRFSAYDKARGILSEAKRALRSMRYLKNPVFMRMRKPDYSMKDLSQMPLVRATANGFEVSAYSYSPPGTTLESTFDESTRLLRTLQDPDGYHFTAPFMHAASAGGLYGSPGEPFNVFICTDEYSEDWMGFRETDLNNVDAKIYISLDGLPYVGNDEYHPSVPEYTVIGNKRIIEFDSKLAFGELKKFITLESGFMPPVNIISTYSNMGRYVASFSPEFVILDVDSDERINFKSAVS
jgi:hypothetical protein